MRRITSHTTAIVLALALAVAIIATIAPATSAAEAAAAHPSKPAAAKAGAQPSKPAAAKGAAHPSKPAAAKKATPDDAASAEFTYIHVANELGGGKSLSVHCKTMKHDLGIHPVAPKTDYTFKFKTTVANSKTYDCTLKNGKKEMTYKAYYEDAELLRRVNMNKSFWVAKDDGLYLRQPWRNTDTFWRPWP